MKTLLQVFSGSVAHTLSSGQGHLSVGCNANEDAFRLNATADRDRTLAQKAVEGGHQPEFPALSQVGERFSSKRAEPVALTGSGKTGRPAAAVQTAGQTKTNGIDRGLKPGKVPFGP